MPRWRKLCNDDMGMSFSRNQRGSGERNLMHSASVKLLVVDDNPDNREMLTRRLKRLGYEQIMIACDGEEALAMNAETPFDAMLLDVMMPRKSGIEVLEQLRSEHRLEDTPVIMISAATELDTVVRCLELGAEDYLPKPFNPVLLRARLGSVLEKRALRAEVRRQLNRMEAELAEARRQQLSMVPADFPSIADGMPIDVHAVMHPAREVGGDLYDCFSLDQHTLCIAVGDVSDKGMPAALFMARTRSLLRAATLQYIEVTGRQPSPSEIATAMNTELCKNNPFCMFVTLFFGFIDLRSGMLRYVNCGHVRPFLLHGDKPPVELASVNSPPLGVVEAARFRDAEHAVEPGDGMLIISDGVPDMLEPSGISYGLDRVLADLHEVGHLPAAVLTATLSERVFGFARDTPQTDDVTMLVIKRP
jgi:sigma-B regulation protein RsbU (phosphoserine phosphatase)